MVNLSEIVAVAAKEMAEKPRSPKCYTQNSEAVARTLERRGFRRGVAGEEAFKRAVDAICLSCETHRGILFAGANGVGKSHLMRAIYQSTPTTAKEWIDCCDAESLSWLGERFLYDMNVYIKLPPRGKTILNALAEDWRTAVAARIADVSRPTVDHWKTFFKEHFSQCHQAYRRDFGG